VRLTIARLLDPLFNLAENLEFVFKNHEKVFQVLHTSLEANIATSRILAGMKINQARPGKY
jgi:hypothetical protein